MDLGEDQGAQYNKSILLKDNKLAKKVINSIGAYLPVDEEVSTKDEFHEDLRKKLFDKLAGEIPKKIL